MANSADPDQLASSEASWSGSTLFAKARHIRIQQDQGWISQFYYLLKSLYLLHEWHRPWSNAEFCVALYGATFFVQACLSE